MLQAYIILYSCFRRLLKVGDLTNAPTQSALRVESCNRLQTSSRAPLRYTVNSRTVLSWQSEASGQPLDARTFGLCRIEARLSCSVLQDYKPTVQHGFIVKTQNYCLYRPVSFAVLAVNQPHVLDGFLAARDHLGPVFVLAKID